MGKMDAGPSALVESVAIALALHDRGWSADTRRHEQQWAAWPDDDRQMDADGIVWRERGRDYYRATAMVAISAYLAALPKPTKVTVSDLSDALEYFSISGKELTSPPKGGSIPPCDSGGE